MSRSAGHVVAAFAHRWSCASVTCASQQAHALRPPIARSGNVLDPPRLGRATERDSLVAERAGPTGAPAVYRQIGCTASRNRRRMVKRRDETRINRQEHEQAVRRVRSTGRPDDSKSERMLLAHW